MRNELAGVGVDLAITAGYALGAAALTAVGVAAEYSSFRSAVGGDAIMTVWFAFVGLVVLYVGVYLLGYRTLLGGAAAGD